MDNNKTISAFVHYQFYIDDYNTLIMNINENTIKIQADFEIQSPKRESSSFSILRAFHKVMHLSTFPQSYPQDIHRYPQ